MSKIHVILPVVAGLILAACGGDSGSGGGGPSQPDVTVAEAPNSGDGQTATVATALPQPLIVIVRRDGSPASGVNVQWTTPGGSVAPPSVTTDASGLASTTWTLGNTAGSQTAAAAVSGASGSPVGFTATATAGAADALSISSGNNQNGAVNSQLAPLVVQIDDQFGNPVSGTSVNWVVTSGTATVSPGSSSSAANGTASTTATLGGTAGPVTITATAAGLSGSPATFSATATASSPNAVQVVNNQFVPASITIPVNTTVTWTWAQGAVSHTITPDNSANLPNDPTAHSAPHTYSATFTAPGTYDYYCSIHGGPGGSGMSGTVIVQ